MAYLDEIATIVGAGTTEAGSTHATWPVFKGHLPDSTVHADSRAVALLNSPGFGDLGGPSSCSGRLWVERPGLQVLTRGLSLSRYSSAYQEAEAVARSVKNALHGFTGPSSSGGTHYLGVWSENGPAFIGYDESMRPLFSSNFRVERSKS